jgi:hypothetical protein
MSKKILRLVALLFLALLGAFWLFRPDPRLAKAKALQAELFGPQGKQLSPDQRTAKMREFRETTKGLSSTQRRQLGAEGRKQKQREIARYFTLPPREKVQFLDQQIRREQQFRQQMQARGGGAPKGPPTKGAAPKGKGGTEQERDQRRQVRLDSTSPSERALMNQYMKDLNSRRSQLGIPPRGGGGPR